MRRTILLVTLVGAVLLACSGVVLAQQSSERTPSDRGGQPSFAEEKQAGAAVPDRYIVVLNDNENARSVAEEHMSSRAAEVSHVYEHALKGYAARIPSSRLSEVENDPRVQFVQQDRTAVASGQTKPTGIDRIQADESSTRAGDGSGSVDVGVAILDTGINKTHQDLNHAGGRNFAIWGSPNNKYEDGHGHGTHVAGTIGAKDNDIGPVGVAPGARLYGVKVLSNSGSGYQSWIIAGIDWVIANGPGTPTDIKVANMSLGGSGSDDSNCGNTNKDAYHKAICRATTGDPAATDPAAKAGAGVTFVVAAGNSNANLKGFVPAAYNEVLSVTAVSDSDGTAGGTGGAPSCRTGEKDDFPATFSNYATPDSADKDHTIAFPGVCIYSTWKSGGYNTISGTSMASPHGAGTAALCIINGACDADTDGDGKVTPSDVIRKLRDDASTWGQANGFTNDPGSTPLTGRYYGYLAHANGY